MQEERSYQTKLVRQTVEAVREARSACMVLPTGGGKTVCAAELARLAASIHSRTLLLVHRRELVRQAIDTLAEALPGLSVGVQAAGWPELPWAPLQVGSVMSMARRGDRGHPPRLVIVDEAHHARASTWETVLGRWPGVALVGLTATPQRLDGKGLGEHFARLVVGPSIHELVRAGHLAPTVTYRPNEAAMVDLRGLSRRAAGDYSRKELRRRAGARAIAAPVESYRRYAPGSRAIFFGFDRRHSEDVAARFREAGIRAEHVDGSDHPGRRDRVMQEFRNGAIDVVCNCDLISEGFDAPACDCVILGAPTRSVVRMLQAAGRAMRPGPGKVARFIDAAGATHDLGLPDEDREWSLEDGDLSVEKRKPRQQQQCSCGAVFYRPPCPGCGARPATVQVDELDVELEEARRRGRGQQVRGKRQQLYRQLAGVHRLPDGDRETALVEIARERGYKAGWVNHILSAWAIRESA